MNVTKYNYTDSNSKNVKLWLKDDFTELFWKQDGKLLKSSLKADQINGILFGAFSSTFTKHKEYALNFDKFKSTLSVSPTKDKRGRRMGVNVSLK